MRGYSLNCKIITPLFMGGADQKPEVRTQSINGLLRWWFRIAGGTLEDEKRLFGWAGEDSRQGLARIRIVGDFDPEAFASNGNGYDYLGFSLKMTKREAVPVGTKINLKISFLPKATNDDIQKFFASLWLAFNLGNFGSRARRGFGSIKIEKIEENGIDITNNCWGLDFIPPLNNIENIENWINKNFEKIKEILTPTPRENIPYLFDNFEIYFYKENKDWKALLNSAGEEYREFRRTQALDKRIVFGLPIIGSKDSKKRRASPLIFKIIESKNQNYILLFIAMKPNDKRSFIFHPEKNQVDWSLISQFFDFLKTKEKVFP